MKISVLLNVHDHPNLVIDTLESIKTWVTNDVMVMIDGASVDKFKIVNWSNTKVFSGMKHNFHKSPYRNIAFGLKKLYESFPQCDWYFYIEYDCLFTSNAYLSDLQNRNPVSCLACDIRKNKNIELEILESIVKKEIKNYYTMLGCCVFYSGKFLKIMYDANLFDKILETTKDMPKGHFTGYKQYAFEETLYPTLVSLFGGSVYELGAWRKSSWSNGKYLCRFRPDVTEKEISPNPVVIHPLKAFNGCPVRTKFKKERESYLKWHDKKICADKIAQAEQKIEYIICGTGRCGTSYMTALFNSLGIPCGHERIFNHQGCCYNNYGFNSGASKSAGISQVTDPSQPLKAEASYMAAPFLLDDFLKDAQIIHIVRHPIDVINSFVNGLGYFLYKDLPSDEYEKFMLKYLPELCNIKHPLLKAAYYYVEWNKIIESAREKLPYTLFCIEEDILTLLNRLNIEHKADMYSNKKCNSAVDKNLLTWKDIPDSDIKEELLDMYKRYYKR